MTYKEIQTEKYKSFESQNQRWREGQERFITEYFNHIPRELSILDLGCGDGVGLRYFKQLGFENVIGVEFCHEKAIKAANYYPVLGTDMHEIDDWVLAAGSIDIVYSSHSLEHAHNPAKVLRIIFRILKPGGKLFLVLPYPDIGPEDAHCGKLILGTDKLDDCACLEALLQHTGFQINKKSFGSFREPEVWLELQKI